RCTERQVLADNGQDLTRITSGICRSAANSNSIKAIGLLVSVSKTELRPAFSHVLAPEIHHASYRRQAPVLNGERTRSRYEPGAAPSVFLRVAIRGYSFHGSTAPRRVRLRPPI